MCCPALSSFAQVCPILPCIVWQFLVLFCAALGCLVRCWFVLVLCCIVMCCAISWRVVLSFMVLYCDGLYYMTLDCFVLCCVVVCCDVL